MMNRMSLVFHRRLADGVAARRHSGSALEARKREERECIFLESPIDTRKGVDLYIHDIGASFAEDDAASFVRSSS